MKSKPRKDPKKADRMLIEMLRQETEFHSKYREDEKKPKKRTKPRH